MGNLKEENEEQDYSCWQKTYEKQRRVQLMRDGYANEETESSAESSAEPLRDFIAEFLEGKDISFGTVPAVPVRYASIPPVVLPTASPNEDSGGFAQVVPQRSTTASPAARSEGDLRHSTFKRLIIDSSDGQSSLCNAMCSLSVSSSHSTSASLPLVVATPRRRKKWYVVSAGKCTGVFDNWPLVQSYTSGVSGSCQKSYSTYDEAFEVYETMKKKGLVQVLRNPGDEAYFGCIEGSSRCGKLIHKQYEKMA